VDDRDKLRTDPLHNFFASALARGDERTRQRVGGFRMLRPRWPGSFGGFDGGRSRRALLKVGARGEERCAKDGDRPQNQRQPADHACMSQLRECARDRALEAKSVSSYPVTAKIECGPTSRGHAFRRLSRLDPAATIQPRRFAYPIRPILALAPASDSRPSASAPMNGCPNLGPALPVRLYGRRPRAGKAGLQRTGSADEQRLFGPYNSRAFECFPRSQSGRDLATAPNAAAV
jgi:hypothetical protein